MVLKRIGRASWDFIAIVKVELLLSDRAIGTAKWGFEIFFGLVDVWWGDSSVETRLIVVSPERGSGR